MFDALPLAPPDAILGLTDAFKRDSNPQKINLSAGVYKDEQGNTPILQSVKQAERRILESEQSKGYLSIEGHAEYAARVQELLFGPASEISEKKRAVTAQTPGGTGALRVGADFLSKHFAGAKVWLSKPTWANHAAIFMAAGLKTEQYTYLDGAARKLDFPAMIAALRQAAAGDVVLLHACCHNPSGIDPTRDQWREIAATLAERKLLPLVDFAYQGFGDGIDEDAAGLREILATSQELLVCSSFSKNFGLYGERVGALTLVAESPEAAERALSQIRVSIRTNYSNPPTHGAAIVATILGDQALRTHWEQELAAMRTRIHEMRRLLVAGLREKAPGHDFSFLESQRGMFSFSGLSNMQVDELRSKHSVYVVAGGGRINVAGITRDNVGPLCEAIAAVL